MNILYQSDCQRTQGCDGTNISWKSLYTIDELRKIEVAKIGAKSWPL